MAHADMSPLYQKAKKITTLEQYTQLPKKKCNKTVFKRRET